MLLIGMVKGLVNVDFFLICWFNLIKVYGKCFGLIDGCGYIF